MITGRKLNWQGYVQLLCMSRKDKRNSRCLQSSQEGWGCLHSIFKRLGSRFGSASNSSFVLMQIRGLQVMAQTGPGTAAAAMSRGNKLTEALSDSFIVLTIL